MSNVHNVYTYYTTTYNIIVCIFNSEFSKDVVVPKSSSEVITEAIYIDRLWSGVCAQFSFLAA